MSLNEADTTWKEDVDVGMDGEGIIPMSSLASIESYLMQLKGKVDDEDAPTNIDPIRGKILAAQALGSLHTFLPKSMKADSLRAAIDLGVW
jgi:hypothetical protein